MMALSLFAFLAIIVVLVFMVVGWYLSDTLLNPHDEANPYECGFDPSAAHKVPFSSRFFLIALVFTIFDVEITLMFPVVFMEEKSAPVWTILTLYLLLFMGGGVVYEWVGGTLEWVFDFKLT